MFVTVAVTLCLTYALTLAPGVTFWDAGEFNAAIGTLGIPHPPGTPLYILIGNVWARAFGFLPQALAVNLLSAVATAVACGLLGSLTTRWSRTPVGLKATLYWEWLVSTADSVESKRTSLRHGGLSCGHMAAHSLSRPTERPRV